MTQKQKQIETDLEVGQYVKGAFINVGKTLSDSMRFVTSTTRDGFKTLNEVSATKAAMKKRK